jgi:hypothetical protein
VEKETRRDDQPPVDFPTELEISERAFDMFFQEREAPKVFDEYYRRAESELLERAFQAVVRRSYVRHRFRPGR